MYYLLLDGAQAGPFTLAQLIEMWQARRLTPVTLYWEEGNADWLPLNNIAPLLEMPASAAPAVAPAFPPPMPAATAAPEVNAAGEEVIFDGRPSLWNWTGRMILGIILTPVLIGIVILVHIFWSRSTTRYLITNRRVSLETGIFTRHSRELRLADIRSIAARSNIFGLGDIEFSSAASADAEITFWGITRVEHVRDMVKQLQNTAIVAGGK